MSDMLPCLPKSFKNIILHVSGQTLSAKVRSSITSIKECDDWVKEFGEHSFTRWIVRSSTKSVTFRQVCRRVYLCHHSNYRKIKQPTRKRQKNFNCKARIEIVVQGLNPMNKGSDIFIKNGLPALITMENRHSHEITDPVSLSYLPPVTEDMRAKFEHYFSIGFGMAQSLKHYKAETNANDGLSKEDYVNGFYMPSYNRVKHWHDAWLAKQPQFKIRKLDESDEEEKAFRSMSPLSTTPVTSKIIQVCPYSSSGSIEKTNGACEELVPGKIAYRHCQVKMSEFLDFRVLPKSYKHIILNVDDEKVSAKILSNIVSMEGCISWIKEFEELTFTRWILYVFSKNSSTLRRTYLCHHSKHRKKISTPPFIRHRKNFNCHATINFLIDSSENDNFVQAGYPALITINNAHSHDTTTAAALSYLPPCPGLRSKFENYFSKGFGVAETLKYHKAHIDSDESSAACILPKYGTVKSWHKKWLLKQQNSNDNSFGETSNSSPESASNSELGDFVIETPESSMPMNSNMLSNNDNDTSSPSATRTSSSTMPVVVKLSSCSPSCNDKVSDDEFEKFLEKLKKHHKQYGTSKIILQNALRRLKASKTKNEWDYFLCTAGKKERRKVKKRQSTENGR